MENSCEICGRRAYSVTECRISVNGYERKPHLCTECQRGLIAVVRGFLPESRAMPKVEPQVTSSTFVAEESFFCWSCGAWLTGVGATQAHTAQGHQVSALPGQAPAMMGKPEREREDPVLRERQDDGNA